MYAITAITGQVGGAVARTLLAQNLPVRAVMRDAAKGQPWTDRGCKVAVASMTDTEALTQAFAGAEGVFVLLPPVFDPSPDFRESRAVVASVKAALSVVRPARTVVLSTIGADATQSNLLSQLSYLEAELSTLDLSVTFLRAAWFMENATWDVADARAGRIRSYLQPANKPFAMVSTEDVGRVAAELLHSEWQGTHVVELEGPARVSPNDLAAAFVSVLGHSVAVDIVPRTGWESDFRAQGMTNPEPRLRMLDGFNEGWIDFAPGHARKGEVTLIETVRRLVG